MTPANPDALADAPYVLMERGLFERPGHHGYTGVLRHAGRFSHEEASAYAVHSGSVTMMLASEAPAYSPACWHETQVEDLLDLLRIEREAKATAEARAAQLQAEVEAERQRANEAVIRAGAMEQERNHLRYHYDAAMAAATNDELPANIKKTLAERVAWYRDRWLYVHPALVRSRAEVEALKAKLTEAAEAADAPPSGYSTYQTSIDSEEAHNLRRCREIVRAARTALAARAATAREG